MKVINENKRLLFTLKEKTSGPLVVAPEELTLVEESLQETPTPVDSRPYKVYTALLAQTGTDAPVATVLENTLGDITWFREETGIYYGVSDELFINNKTYINYTQANFKDNIVYQLNNSNIYLEQKQLSTFIPADGIDDASIEIRVYN